MNVVLVLVFFSQYFLLLRVGDFCSSGSTFDTCYLVVSRMVASVNDVCLHSTCGDLINLRMSNASRSLSLSLSLLFSARNAALSSESLCKSLG